MSLPVVLILAALVAGVLGYWVSVGLAALWLILVAVVLLARGGVAP